MSTAAMTAAYNPIALPVWRKPDPPAWLEHWAAFATTFDATSMSPSLVTRTRQVVADSIAAIAAGSQEPEIAALVSTAAGADAGVAVIGRGRRADIATAAFLGGTAGTMLELDEGNQYARGHPGIHVVPAALAVGAERQRSAHEVLAAIALGYEIGARIGYAAKLNPAMHPHGTWGTIGAAVCVARLQGADAAQMRDVINVASSLGLTTSRRTMLEGGTVRNAFAGFSNQLGIMAWRLVSAGFTGEADGVGTVYGRVIADQWTPDLMTEALGSRWEIERNYFKRHACCRYNHGALDALAVALGKADGTVGADDISRIDVETYIWAAQLAGQEPQNMLAAKFSLPFSIATTIVHGAATVPAFRAPALANDTIRKLARRVFVVEDPALTAQLPRLRPSRVRLTLTDGRVLEASAQINRGDDENPYSPRELEEKYLELTSPVWGVAHATSVRELVQRMESARHMQDLDTLLAHPVEGSA